MISIGAIVYMIPAQRLGHPALYCCTKSTNVSGSVRLLISDMNMNETKKSFHTYIPSMTTSVAIGALQSGMMTREYIVKWFAPSMRAALLCMAKTR